MDGAPRFGEGSVLRVTERDCGCRSDLPAPLVVHSPTLGVRHQRESRDGGGPAKLRLGSVASLSGRGSRACATLKRSAPSQSLVPLVTANSGQGVGLQLQTQLRVTRNGHAASRHLPPSRLTCPTPCPPFKKSRGPVNALPQIAGVFRRCVASDRPGSRTPTSPWCSHVHGPRLSTHALRRRTQAPTRPSLFTTGSFQWRDLRSRLTVNR